MSWIGPYGSTRPSPQPPLLVHTARAMWSVKKTPNPGLAWIAARRTSPAVVGLRWRSKVRLMGLVVLSSGASVLPAKATRARARSQTGGDGVTDSDRGARRTATLGEVGGHRLLHPLGLGGPPEVGQQHPDRQDRRGGVGLALPGDVRRRAVHRLEHARMAALGVDVAAGREPDAARDRRGDVGDDVAEQVVGDDHVEATGVGGEEDRGR